MLILEPKSESFIMYILPIATFSKNSPLFFCRQADEMLDAAELDQNKTINKGFVRLNSLEEEDDHHPETMQAAKSCCHPITETPKRQQMAVNRQLHNKSASYYHHHRARHRTHHSNHWWQRQLLYQQQQQFWWGQQFYYPPQPSLQITQVPYNSFVKGYTWPNSDSSFHLSPKAAQYPGEGAPSDNSFYLSANPTDASSFHPSGKSVAHEVGDRGFPLRVNNFLPELSFADHAAMAAAAMESAENTTQPVRYGMPALLSVRNLNSIFLKHLF